MPERKTKKPASHGMSTEEARTPFVHTKPGELADAVIKDLSDRMREATERIKEVREDMSRGARTSKEKFRI